MLSILPLNQSIAWFQENPTFFFVPILFMPIFVAGFIGNLWLIMVISRGDVPPTSSNIYTLSLAFGDLSFFFSVIPFMLTIYPIGRGPSGTFICKISEFLRDFNVNVIALTLIAMSFDRYYAVLSAVTWMRRQGTPRHKLWSFSVVCLIWLVSALLAVPSALLARSEWTDPVHTSNYMNPVCYSYPQGFETNYTKLIVIKFIFLYLVPLSVSGFCNTVVVRKLIVNVKSKLCYRKTQQEKALRKAQFTARIAFLFVTMFLICFMPHHLFSLWFYFYPPSNEVYAIFCQTSRIVAFICAFLDSAINPIIICSTSYCLKKYVKSKTRTGKVLLM